MEFLKKAYRFDYEGNENKVYTFRFTSIGESNITKVVSISPINGTEDWHNLGFGNLEKKNGVTIVNDTSEKNNADYDEVLATVFMCALYFLKLRPDASITFFGNTVHKHRMYIQKISVNLESLTEGLNVLGGRINNEIVIEEKEQVIIRNGKSRTRTIKIKDIDATLASGVMLDHLEKYEVEKSRTYQFVLIGLK